MVLNTEQNSLIVADCLDLLKEWYKNGKRNFIDLLYIDPPFNSNRNYNVIFGSEFDLSEEAFRDTWSSISYLDELEDINTISPNLFNFLKMLENTGLPKSYISYLTKMSIRCWFMREMLKDTGSFYFHCDPTMSHYIKVILDYIFSRENFRNEIVWYYKTGGISKKYFAKKHDIIFFYTKTKKYIFNPQRELKTHKAMTRAIEKGDEMFEDKGGKYTWYLRPGRNPKYPKGVKVYIEAYVRDIWDIPAIAPVSSERIGYETQKPEKLLERIILASSNENDVVADLFLGGGTTIDVADRLNRKWLGVDINLRAIQLTQGRLEKVKKIVKKDYIIEGIPNSAKALRAMVDQNILGKDKNSKFALEDITVKYYLHDVVGNEVKVGDGSIDGRFGFDYKGKKRIGLVQVTAGANINHFSSFCLAVKSDEEKADLGVYISFENRIPKSWYIKAKQQGKIGNVDRVQILTFENLIDNRQQFQKPSEVLTV
jgi:site-specific DNA-methyltransferase (adenine-specific)